MSRRNLRSKLNAAAVVVGLAVWLGNTGAAFALGGSGSADFGGGDGGGGGGGFGGSGSGGGGAGHVPAGVWIVIACAVVVVLFGGGVYAWLRILPRRWRVHRRERRVRAAAAIAAQDDPAFAMDQVLAEAGVLWLDIQAAWDARDRSRLRRLVGPELWAEWDRRLRDFDRKGWRNRVKPLGRPRVEYVGLHHGGEPDGDRVVVAVEARMQDYVQGPGGERIPRQGSSSLTIDTFQYWTLAKQDRRRDPEERWILVSVEDAAEGKHELTDVLVAAPEYAVGKMRDEALVESAVAESVPPGTNIAELADLEFDGDARQAANDLSLADGRFAPDIPPVPGPGAGHPRDRSPPRRSRLGPGDRRRSSRSRAHRRSRGDRRVAAPGGPEREDEGGGARATRPEDADREPRSEVGPTEHAAGDRARGSALRGGSRHQGDAVRESDAACTVHRALDAGHLRGSGSALADRLDCRPGEG